MWCFHLQVSLCFNMYISLYYDQKHMEIVDQCEDVVDPPSIVLSTFAWVCSYSAFYSSILPLQWYQHKEKSGQIDMTTYTMSFGTEKIPEMSKFWNEKDKNSSYELTLPFCKDVGLLFFSAQLQATKERHQLISLWRRLSPSIESINKTPVYFRWHIPWYYSPYKWLNNYQRCFHQIKTKWKCVFEWYSLRPRIFLNSHQLNN